MSNVESLYKALEFTFPVIFQTTASYQTIVFLEAIYIISEMSQFKCK